MIVAPGANVAEPQRAAIARSAARSNCLKVGSSARTSAISSTETGAAPEPAVCCACTIACSPRGPVARYQPAIQRRSTARGKQASAGGPARVDRGANDRDTAGRERRVDNVAASRRDRMAGIEIGRYLLDGSVAGAGPPLLFLHGGDYVAQNGAFLGRLARRWQVSAPRHPGFGHSERPDGFRTIHDLAYLYLDWLDRQPADKVVVVGSSFDGWIALELC